MSARKPRILVATKNTGKLAEFTRILGEEFDVQALQGIDVSMPDEGTSSYRENAEEKARFVAAATGCLTLGDDSGIEARALGDRPGIISARFAGEPVSDRRNIDKLLQEMKVEECCDRSARFVCWLALAGPDGVIASRAGTCEGTIGFEQRRNNGFGYDPVFVFSDGRSMAELSDEEKDALSHRGNAIRAILPVLRHAVVDGDNDA